MLKLVRKLQSVAQIQSLYFNSSAKNVPSVAGRQRQDFKFFSNVYGIKVDHHVLLKKRMQLSEEEYKFYQKTSPNYLVALVKKVLDHAEAGSQEN